MSEEYPSRWKKQLENLVKYVPSVSKVGYNYDHWTLRAHENNKAALFDIHLYLDPRFPVTPPRFYIDPAKGTIIKHSWISSDNYVIGHPKLYEWNYQNQLGVIFAEILQEFKHKPPKIIRYEPLSPKSSPLPSNPTPPARQNKIYALPLPITFPSLANKKSNELKSILESDELIKTYIYDHPEVQSILNYNFNLLNQIANLINLNENLFSQFNKIENEVLALQNKKQKNLDLLYQLIHTYNANASESGTAYLKNLLTAKIHQSMQDVKDLKSKSNNNTIDWKTYSEYYIANRKQYHMLMAIKEKISQT